MKAIVVDDPGVPEVLQIRERPYPISRPGWVLIRGGTSSVGMAAATIAQHLGAMVIATTRNVGKRAALLANGASHTKQRDLVAVARRVIGVNAYFTLQF